MAGRGRRRAGPPGAAQADPRAGLHGEGVRAGDGVDQGRSCATQLNPARSARHRRPTPSHPLSNAHTLHSPARPCALPARSPTSRSRCTWSPWRPTSRSTTTASLAACTTRTTSRWVGTVGCLGLAGAAGQQPGLADTITHLTPRSLTRSWACLTASRCACTETCRARHRSVRCTRRCAAPRSAALQYVGPVKSSSSGQAPLLDCHNVPALCRTRLRLPLSRAPLQVLGFAYGLSEEQAGYLLSEAQVRRKAGTRAACPPPL